MHAIIEDLAARAAAGEPGLERRGGARSATSTPPSWTRTAIDGARAARRSRRSSPRSTALRDVARPGGVPRRVRAHRRGTGCSAPTSTPTPGTPTATSSTWSRAVSGCPTSRYYREDKFAEIREKYVAYLTRLLDLARAARRRRPRPPAILEIDTRLAEGHWERAETRDVQKTYNLMTLGRAPRARPGVRLGRLHHQPRRHRGRPAPRPSSGSRRTSRTSPRSSSEVPIEDWKVWLVSRVLRSLAPYLTDDFVEANFDFYGRTLNGTPELRARWKRGVGAGRGRDRRGGRQGVRRPALPAARPRR